MWDKNDLEECRANLSSQFPIEAPWRGITCCNSCHEANPNAKIALISKVYPIRSHTVAAEGGSTAVAQDHDSFDITFTIHVAGGDWLCEQYDADYFVHHCPTEMTQLELWGCPWRRRPDGSVIVRRFGGMKMSAPGSPPIRPASICCTRCSRPLCNSRKSGG
ncbi:FAD-binding protein [Escherichia coli]